MESNRNFIILLGKIKNIISKESEFKQLKENIKESNLKKKTKGPEKIKETQEEKEDDLNKNGIDSKAADTKIKSDIPEKKK